MHICVNIETSPMQLNWWKDEFAAGKSIPLLLEIVIEGLIQYGHW